MKNNTPKAHVWSDGRLMITTKFTFKGSTYEATRFNLGKIEVYLKQHKDASREAWAGRWVGYADEVSSPLAAAADRALGDHDLRLASAVL